MARPDFTTDAWQRPGGGGGVARVLEGGALFEKAGVNWSSVDGELPAELADHMPGQGRTFRASGVSLVLHPRSPMVPTTHANFRCLTKGEALWFGGGADLTPYYFFREDAVHFHRTLAARLRPPPPGRRLRPLQDVVRRVLLPAAPQRDPRASAACSSTTSARRASTRRSRCSTSCATSRRSFADAYLPIAQRRQPMPYGETERTWQLRRRGRYVEFNLIYDRGTLFGLKTNGRVESILMSLPPLVRWDYDVMAQPGSPEAELLTHLRPTDWLARGQ